MSKKSKNLDAILRHIEWPSILIYLNPYLYFLFTHFLLLLPYYFLLTKARPGDESDDDFSDDEGEEIDEKIIEEQQAQEEKKLSESRVGRVLSELTTKKVIILVFNIYICLLVHIVLCI